MVLLIRGNVVQSLTQYNAVPDGNVALPGLSFAHAPATGVSRTAEGNVVVSVGGTAAMEVSTEGITANAFVGDGAGISNIVAANIDGLSQALDVIDASSVSSNVFIGNGAGLSNIAAGNVTGLTAALDVIDASSVTANAFVGNGAGISNIVAANIDGLSQALDVIDASSVTSNVVYGDVSGDLQIGANLVPTSNVAFNLGTELLRFKDLYLSGNTIDLGGSLIQSVLGNVVIGNLDVTNIRGNGRGLSGIAIPPSITSVVITDSNWNPIDDLALSTTSTGYFLVEGTNFEPVGTTVSVGGTAAASITVANSQLLRVSVNPKSTGTYDVVVQTGSGTTSKINGVSFDPFPVWSTGSALGNVAYGNAFSITLSASDGGSNITYSNTSALPPSTTLASNGVLQGNITGNTSATYNFTVEAIDAQLQSALRSFSLNYRNFVSILTDGLLVDSSTDGGNWYAVKYMYDTTTPMAPSQNHTTSNYYITISRIQQLAAYASDMLFREDSSSTLAKCASTSVVTAVRDNIINGRGWFYNTHGINTLAGWLVGVNGGNIPDAKQSNPPGNAAYDPSFSLDGYSSLPRDTTESSRAVVVFDSYGDSTRSHTWLNSRIRMRADTWTTFKVHSIWFKIQ